MDQVPEALLARASQSVTAWLVPNEMAALRRESRAARLGSQPLGPRTDRLQSPNQTKGEAPRNIVRRRRRARSGPSRRRERTAKTLRQCIGRIRGLFGVTTTRLTEREGELRADWLVAEWGVWLREPSSVVDERVSGAP